MRQVADIIRRLIDSALSKNQAGLAAYLGISPSKITDAMRRGAIPEAWLYKVAYRTGYSVEWLRTGRGEKFQAAFISEGKVPYLTKIPAGPMGSALDPYPYPGAAEDFLSLAEKGKRVIALKVRGVSMEPEFREGDYIVIDLEARIQPGDLVVAVTDEDSEGTFKRYVKKKDGFVLQPINPEFKEIPVTAQHRIVGRVIRLIRQY